MAEVADASTAVASVSVNPVAAAQAGRIGSLRTLLSCNSSGPGRIVANGNQEPLPVAQHPLRFALPAAGAELRYSAAAVVGAAVVVTGAAALVTLCAALAAAVAWCRLAMDRDRQSQQQSDEPPTATPAATLPPAARFHAFLELCRFPASLSLSVMYLSGPMAEHGARCLAGVGATTTSMAIGAVGLASCVACTAGGAAFFRRTFRRSLRWSVDALDEDPLAAEPSRAVEDTVEDRATRRLNALLLVDDKEWAAAAGPAHTASLMKRFGMLFDAYRGKAPWFLLAEFSLSVALGCLAGVQEALGCRVSAWLSAAVTTTFALALGAIRPHAVRFDRVLYFVLAALQAAAAAMAAVMLTLPPDFETARGRLAVVASYVVSVTASSATLVGVYEAIKVVYYQVLVWRREKLRKAAEEAASVEAARAAGALLLVLGGDAPPPMALASSAASNRDDDADDGGGIDDPNDLLASLLGALTPEPEVDPEEEERRAEALRGARMRAELEAFLGNGLGDGAAGTRTEAPPILPPTVSTPRAPSLRPSIATMTLATCCDGTS